MVRPDMSSRRTLLLAALAAPPVLARAQPAPAPWVVCAVAGLQPGLAQLEQLWRAQGGRPLRLQSGTSATLARIVEQGGPCDVLALADPQRMDALEARRLVRPDSRQNLLGNDLVLVTAADQPLPRRLVQAQDLLPLLGEGKLALPDPAQTSAGRVAREALTNLEIWDGVQRRLVPVAEGRAALDLVRKGEARFGIAMLTDAFELPGLRIALTFPADSHALITYPFALPRRGDAAAAELLGFIAGSDAAAVWRRLGLAPR
jgi:molybdate transport system substrate-binding protein